MKTLTFNVAVTLQVPDSVAVPSATLGDFAKIVTKPGSTLVCFETEGVQEDES